MAIESRGSMKSQPVNRITAPATTTPTEAAMSPTTWSIAALTLMPPPALCSRKPTNALIAIPASALTMTIPPVTGSGCRNLRAAS